MGRKRSRHHGLPPHMRAKASLRGTNYYYVFNGTSRWEPLGKDLPKALRRWADLEAGGAVQGLTVADLVQRYIDREQRSASTAKQYKSYQAMIAADFPILASQLTSRHVALWREKNGGRRAVCNGVIAVLLATSKLGHELGLCQQLVVQKWKQEGRDRVLDAAEFIRIREHAVEWLQVAMNIGYLTGARPVDIRKLTWSEVGGDSVSLRQKKTKTRQRFVTNDALESVFAAARERPVLGLYVVATAKGQPVSEYMMQVAWREACKAAGVADAQFRDIRPMAAKAAEEDGQDIQKLLGHTTRAMSEKYLKGRRIVNVEPVRRKL